MKDVTSGGGDAPEGKGREKEQKWREKKAGFSREAPEAFVFETVVLQIVPRDTLHRLGLVFGKKKGEKKNRVLGRRLDGCGRYIYL